MLMSAHDSCLLVIDIQAKLNPVMFDPDRAPDGSANLLKAAEILGIPALLTEQYPKGVGETVEGLQDLMPVGCPVEKNTFSCLGEEAFAEKFEDLGRPQVVIAGIEAHICVLQTALELLDRGFDVFVVEDATASRTRENHRAGLERIRDAGGWVVTVEMVLFEWLKRSGTPEFKQISQLIK